MNGMAAHDLACVRMQAFQRGRRSPVDGRWQQVDDRVEEWNDPDISHSGTAVERNNRAGLDGKSKPFAQVFLRQLTHREILFQ